MKPTPDVEAGMEAIDLQPTEGPTVDSRDGCTVLSACWTDKLKYFITNKKGKMFLYVMALVYLLMAAYIVALINGNNTLISYVFGMLNVVACANKDAYDPLNPLNAICEFTPPESVYPIYGQFINGCRTVTYGPEPHNVVTACTRF